jgi:acetyltransferase-like isoleucine patch superfamily enzyme
MSASGFMDEEELAALGLAACGERVRIDRSACFYGVGRISIGSDVRIDAYSVLSAGKGGIVIGDHVHLGVYVFLTGAARIELGDFSGLSGRVSVYSSNDDYSGEALTGPTIPDELRKVHSAPVTIGKHVIVGAGSVILPGTTLETGAAVGALTLVKGTVPEFTIVAGPGRAVSKPRKRDILELERRLIGSKARRS